jgi:hypothetical protein
MGKIGANCLNTEKNHSGIPREFRVWSGTADAYFAMKGNSSRFFTFAAKEPV